ncbi:hypothetical protein HGRIS_014427 [Hohenbuehelia grisea]|uniref:Aminoglycoside phosphotransferase domain-containing protein n=1 Tax=Hohenbuehelia grisea TaxID=104357 RepID=A0ABR3JVC7_9AGAR
MSNVPSRSIVTWDADGNQLLGNSLLDEQNEKWKAGEDLPIRLRQLFKDIEEAVSGAIDGAAFVRRTPGRNSITLLELTDGRTFFIRQFHEDFNASDNHPYFRRFQNEANVVNWLRQKTRIPVPEFIDVRRTLVEHPLPYLLTPKLNGKSLYDAVSGLDMATKKNLAVSCAKVNIELFRLEVPQQIGSTASDGSGGLSVIPMIGWKPELCADRVFDSLEEYIIFLFSLRRQTSIVGTDDAEKERARQTLNELEAFVLRHARTLDDPAMRRCILSHDPEGVDDLLLGAHGDVTAVLDWEFHAIKPAILAVRYPPWFDYSGSFDPRYAWKPQEEHLKMFWLVTADESRELVKHYDEFVKNQDPEYYSILKAGISIRAAVSWLETSPIDVGCVFLRAWMDAEVPKL